jgi:hypothetical protein
LEPKVLKALLAHKALLEFKVLKVLLELKVQ